ncbi:hypothetical protein CQA38_00040 [Campylobacter sp. MIT 12-5580]|uniref:hypothetical protein n=1 Tax=Campylobacter sp. MIT 12-5580 TaxID=2040651 RepID=UPI0010F83FCC|nr:hypothetical protein [Campylobacter sp. MIT 12-5580]TKX30068.1 hypothetical protein CQA38_00040 [Campylobacter sp. MIT 12-5580]
MQAQEELLLQNKLKSKLYKNDLFNLLNTLKIQQDQEKYFKRLLQIPLKSPLKCLLCGIFPFFLSFGLLSFDRLYKGDEKLALAKAGVALSWVLLVWISFGGYYVFGFDPSFSSFSIILSAMLSVLWLVNFVDLSVCFLTIKNANLKSLMSVFYPYYTSVLYEQIQSKVQSKHKEALFKHMQNADENELLRLMGLRLKSPYLSLIFSLLPMCIFCGLSLDRFYKGDLKIGVMKLGAFLAVFVCMLFLTPDIRFYAAYGFACLFVFNLVDIYFVYKGICKDNLEKIFQEKA